MTGVSAAVLRKQLSYIGEIGHIENQSPGFDILRDLVVKCVARVNIDLDEKMRSASLNMSCHTDCPD